MTVRDLTVRKAELADGLLRVEDRIREACRVAGREREDVTLIVVTKTYPASDVRMLAELGVQDVAENRDQEAAPKAQECADLSLRWHYVGQLQSNKARSVANYADVVHSVDRPRLVSALSRAATRLGRELDCLLQVAFDAGSTDGSTAGSTDVSDRGGAHPDTVLALADSVAAAQGLRLAGVMTVAPLSGPYEGRPRATFEQLGEISTRLQAAHPAANMVSAGMSGDLEEAVKAGATHVRVGSAVLGQRPQLG